MSAKQRKKAAAASSHSVTHTNDGNTAQSNGASKFLPSSPPSSADPETATAQPLTASATPAASNGGSAVTRPPSVSSFIGKLYAIVSNPATQHIICWAEHGQSFLVKDEYAFSRNIMRQHFRHSNFSSFVRQLNFYGFHKRSTPSAVTQVTTDALARMKDQYACERQRNVSHCLCLPLPTTMSVMYASSSITRTSSEAERTYCLSLYERVRGMERMERQRAGVVGRTRVAASCTRTTSVHWASRCGSSRISTRSWPRCSSAYCTCSVAT